MIHFYSPAPRPSDEDARQAAVERSGLLTARGHPELERLVGEAARLFGVPMAAISIVDRDRQYFTARYGFDADETSRAVSFCAYAMLDRTHGLVVRDARQDARFAANPLVTNEMGLRFYAGMPIVTDDGRPLGALCVVDTVPREPDTVLLEALRALADQVGTIAAG